RVVGVVHHAAPGIRADDLDRGAVAVNVVLAGLTVVLDNEDRRVLPVRAVRDGVDDLAGREVVVGDLSGRVERATGVVAGQPEHVQVGRAVLLEVLLPDLVPVQVRDGGVELRVRVHRDVVQRRDRRAGDLVDGRRLPGRVHVLGVAVETGPVRAGRDRLELVE